MPDVLRDSRWSWVLLIALLAGLVFAPPLLQADGSDPTNQEADAEPQIDRDLYELMPDGEAKRFLLNRIDALAWTQQQLNQAHRYARVEDDLGLAVMMAKHYRFPETAPTLVDIIDKPPLFHIQQTLGNAGFGESYQCANALIQIGIPGAKACMSRVDSSEPLPDKARKLCVWVVYRVYSGSYVKHWLESRLQFTKSGQRKANLEAALADYRELWE